MARAMIELGVTDCVLLDSGMSTCLVWKGSVRVDGTPGTGRMDARIVPHAFVVR
jgi:hypothetical protein